MFSGESGGSKVAQAGLAARLREWDWPLIDAQVENDHLVRMGADSMPRPEFLLRVEQLVAATQPAGHWVDRFDLLPARALSGRLAP